jgi:hypothetical protein
MITSHFQQCIAPSDAFDIVACLVALAMAGVTASAVVACLIALVVVCSYSFGCGRLHCSFAVAAVIFLDVVACCVASAATVVVPVAMVACL